MHDDSPAALRNRASIADILAEVLPDRGLVLEIASGGGEHAVHFAEQFPALEWQPSDRDECAIATMQARFADRSLDNLRVPVALDAALAQWPVESADAVVCINMIHISPWSATVGLFEGTARILGEGAPLAIYGPFLEEAIATAPSNLDFNDILRARDPRWALRHREEIDTLADRAGFDAVRREQMPANNLTLVYRKRA